MFGGIYPTGTGEKNQKHKKMTQTFRLYKINLGSPKGIVSGTWTFYAFNPSKI